MQQIMHITKRPHNDNPLLEVVQLHLANGVDDDPDYYICIPKGNVEEEFLAQHELCHTAYAAITNGKRKPEYFYVIEDNCLRSIMNSTTILE